jgi:hypothetical protein
MYCHLKGGYGRQLNIWLWQRALGRRAWPQAKQDHRLDLCARVGGQVGAWGGGMMEGYGDGARGRVWERGVWCWHVSIWWSIAILQEFRMQQKNSNGMFGYNIGKIQEFE